FLTTHCHLTSTLFPYTTLFRSPRNGAAGGNRTRHERAASRSADRCFPSPQKNRATERTRARQFPCSGRNSSNERCRPCRSRGIPDRKSTRLNSSHVAISYAVFC